LLLAAFCQPLKPIDNGKFQNSSCAVRSDQFIKECQVQCNEGYALSDQTGVYVCGVNELWVPFANSIKCQRKSLIRR